MFRKLVFDLEREGKYLATASALTRRLMYRPWFRGLAIMRCVGGAGLPTSILHCQLAVPAFAGGSEVDDRYFDPALALPALDGGIS